MTAVEMHATSLASGGHLSSGCSGMRRAVRNDRLFFEAEGHDEAEEEEPRPPLAMPTLGVLRLIRYIFGAARLVTRRSLFWSCEGEGVRRRIQVRQVTQTGR